MNESEFLVHSRTLPSEQAGELLHLPRQEANWEWMSFFVRRLQPTNVYRTRTEHEEAAFVILGGVCLTDWGEGRQQIGRRKNVFDGFPYALYLPTGSEVTFTAESVCEIAECRVPSNARLAPKLITPREVAGLGNWAGPGNGAQHHRKEAWRQNMVRDRRRQGHYVFRSASAGNRRCEREGSRYYSLTCVLDHVRLQP